MLLFYVTNYVANVTNKCIMYIFIYKCYHMIKQLLLFTHFKDEETETQSITANNWI